MAPDDRQPGAAASLTALADELVTALCDAHPLAAAALGLHDWDDKLPDHTEAGASAAAARVGDIAVRARALDPAVLDAEQRVTRAVLLQQADAMLADVTARAVEYTVSDSDFGPVTELFNLLSVVTITEQRHAGGYLARLAGLPEVFAALADRHRAGISAGRLPVRDHVQAVVAYLDRYLECRDDDPLRRPDPAAGSGVDGAAFQTSRDRLLDEQVRPAVTGYRETLVADVLPHGRSADRGGLCWLPDGAALYAWLARAYTTTDRSPEEWHQIGLDSVAALADEYADIGSRALGSADLEQIFARLQTDPGLRWSSAEELLTGVRAVISRAEQVAPDWFGRLPSQRCTVEPVPAEVAPGLAAGSYMPPAFDGNRPGIFLANTHRATERNRFTAEALAFHEAVPGHHFQMSLAQELTHLPMLRRLAFVNAYLEGWGLYAERLADEMGLYSGDLARLGMLAADSVRAARLVVDTGLHAKGWTRTQAREYMRANSPLPAIEIDQETDRYIAAPGQALSYMAGRLEIQRIRAVAQQRLGGRFDIRAFHDTVLGSGALPLTVLDDVVQTWAADVVRGTAAPAPQPPGNPGGG
jgi:uncharacterized protein (DUF885 family)